MGASLQWRQPQQPDPRTFDETVTFGRGRSRGQGLMVHSDRVGPGVLVLHPTGPSSLAPFARGLNDEGFTVLVPDLRSTEEGNARRMLAAAAEHLTANWHPRLGILAFAGTVPVARDLATAVGADALAEFHESLADQVVDFLTFHLS